MTAKIKCPECGDCEQLQALVDLIPENVSSAGADFICQASLFATAPVKCGCGYQGMADDFGLGAIEFSPQI